MSTDFPPDAIWLLNVPLITGVLGNIIIEAKTLEQREQWDGDRAMGISLGINLYACLIGFLFIYAVTAYAFRSPFFGLIPWSIMTWHSWKLHHFQTKLGITERLFLLGWGLFWLLLFFLAFVFLNLLDPIDNLSRLATQIPYGPESLKFPGLLWLTLLGLLSIGFWINIVLESFFLHSFCPKYSISLKTISIMNLRSYVYFSLPCLLLLRWLFIQ